jgi:hypothetical protein
LITLTSRGAMLLKKLTQLSILIILISLLAKPTQAALLIEPVVGLNVTSSFETPANDILVDKISTKGGGFAYGGRLGYQNLGFQLGLDYLNSTLDLDDFDDETKLTEWAAFAGFEFPVLLRVYAGYIFSANAQAKADGESIKLTEGSGMKVGVGFTALPFLDINFEYRNGTFNELTLGGVDTGAETKYSAIMMGLSLPFAL